MAWCFSHEKSGRDTIRHDHRGRGVIIRSRERKEALCIQTQPVLYLDVLLCVNLFINYILLLTTAKFLGVPYRKLRLLLGAMLGALYALVILLPALPLWATALMKIPMSASMVALAYRWTTWRSFGKQLACLYVVSFSFAGMLFAISCCFHPSGLVLKNAAVYVAVSPLVLLGATVLCYFAIQLLYRITGRHALGCTLCTVTVWKGDRKATFVAKIDTGNSLKEPFSGLPVAVVERSAVEAVLPDALAALTAGGTPLTPGTSIRVVMCHTVSGEGMLMAFQPERCRIRWNQRTIETTAFYIAVTARKVSNTYQGLLHPAILQMGTDGADHPTNKDTDSEADL